MGVVYNALPQAARDPQKSAAQLAWSEFVSRTDILSHSMEKYNTYAQAVQDTIEGFPASLLAGAGRGWTPRPWPEAVHKTGEGVAKPKRFFLKKAAALAVLLAAAVAMSPAFAEVDITPTSDFYVYERVRRCPFGINRK